MEIKLNQEEVFKLFRDIIPATILPCGYQITGMRIEAADKTQAESLVLALEKKNSGAIGAIRYTAEEEVKHANRL